MSKNTPVWISRGRALRQYPWMDGDARADVCVIGGGITGVLCALKLAGEGRSVVLLSSRPVGHGTVSRLMPCSLTDWGQTPRTLVRRVGRENAALLMELTRQAADELESLCRSMTGGAGFARRDCVIYAANDTEADGLRREHAEYRRLGFDCTPLDRAAFGSVFAFPSAGALVIKDGAIETDPCTLTQRAAAEAADRGVIIFENTKAERIAAGENGKVTVHTSTNRKITASKAVIAAGSACSELLDGIAPGRTRYIAASPPVRGFRGWPGRCVVRSFGQPGLICATSPDERVFVSSEAGPGAVGREKLLGALHIHSAHDRRFEELEAAARYLFPEAGIGNYEAGWVFRGLRTADGLPVAGEAGGQPGCLFAVCGGEGGVLLSVLVARMITEQICGRRPEGINLFSPARRRLAG